MIERAKMTLTGLCLGTSICLFGVVLGLLL